MLKQLRFKNWRSLKDVTIDDLQPINVFIGENSSGKTNILDGIRFQRDILQKGLLEVVLESGYIKIQTDALENTEKVELEFSYNLPLSPMPITETVVLQFDKRDVPFMYGRRLYEGDSLLMEDPLRELPVRDVIETTAYWASEEQIQKEKRSRELLGYLNVFIQKRWQILGDNFLPKLRLSRRDGGDLYVIEPDAQNTLLILDFMKQVQPDLYDQLQEDLGWLLSHVTGISIWHQPENRDLEMLIREQEGKSAPTVSAGTSRLIGILTAIYALDMPQENPYGLEPKILTPEMPGLVVIEEPDTALNPGLLGRFVSQLRNYTEGEYPRQFILTTHNPSFLDYFEPEEVRVVERNQQGYTEVKRIPEHVREIWLDKYGLGEVWTTRSLGGVPE